LVHITFYTARHTFATFLKFESTPVDAISEMLGHTDIRTTEAYLNKLPNKKLDKIIDYVFEKSKYF
jgi:integrase